MPYVPPHLRPGFKREAPLTQKVRRRGVHYKSDKSFLPTHNISERRINLEAPLKTAREVKKIHLLSRKQIKSVLKGKQPKATRKVHSVSLIKPGKMQTLKAKTK